MRATSCAFLGDMPGGLRAAGAGGGQGVGARGWMGIVTRDGREGGRIAGELEVAYGVDQVAEDRGEVGGAGIRWGGGRDAGGRSGPGLLGWSVVMDL